MPHLGMRGMWQDFSQVSARAQTQKKKKKGKEYAVCVAVMEGEGDAGVVELVNSIAEIVVAIVRVADFLFGDKDAETIKDLKNKMSFAQHQIGLNDVTLSSQMTQLKSQNSAMLTLKGKTRKHSLILKRFCLQRSCGPPKIPGTCWLARWQSLRNSCNALFKIARARRDTSMV